MTRNIQQLFDLKGQSALITGGSRGLGLQMAHALGEAGARVVISSRKATDLEEATAELQAAGIDAALDDRGLRPGAMFADMELIGIPHRIVVSERGLAAGTFEYRARTAAEAENLDKAGVLARIAG